MNSRFAKLFVFLTVALLFSHSQNIYAASITVNDSCSLSDAITAANTDTATGGCVAGNGADTITLTADVTLSAELPMITTSMIVEGANYTVSGDDAYRVFYVKAGTLTINNLTITKGNSTIYGGGIAALYGSTVNINNSTISENWSTIGAEIFNSSSALNIHNSIFKDNTASNLSGGIQNWVGTATISGSFFSGNSSGVSTGGAIDSVQANLQVTNSTFTGNTAHRYGGAIAANGLVELINNTVVNNTAQDGGGGIWFGVPSQTSVNLINNIIADNVGGDCVATPGMNVNNIIKDGSCSASTSGDPMLGDLTGTISYYPLLAMSPALNGGSDDYCPPVDQIGTARPQGASCDIGAYEAPSVMGLATPTDTPTGTMTPTVIPTATLTPTHTPANTATPTACTLALKIIAANTDTATGACPAGSGFDTISLTGNITLGAALPQITSEIWIAGNGFIISGDDSYRIFDVYGGNLRVNNLTMTAGHAARMNGGAVKVTNGGQATFINVVISESTASLLGGGIYLDQTARVTVNNSIIKNNSAGSGGGIGFFDGNVYITRSEISNNTAVRGGGIFSTRGKMSIDNSNIHSNTATVSGGGIYTIFGFDMLTLITVANNSAASYGGMYEASSFLALHNSLFGGNSGVQCGGLHNINASVGNLVEDGSCLAALTGDPMLGALTGSPAYYPLLTGSPAINAAAADFCLLADQAGQTRPFPLGGSCDIGAYELHGNTMQQTAIQPQNKPQQQQILQSSV